MKTKYLIASCVLAATMAGSQLLVRAQQTAVGNDGACTQQVALVNNRSRLLTSYKQGEERSYKQTRKKTASRITYAGQWVPKEAEQARSALYRYDDLHRSLIQEVDKQIEAYKYLETDPLDCSDAKKQLLNEKVLEITGTKDRKAVSGQALLQQKKRDATKHVNDAFNEANKRMIKKLHDAKENGNKPDKSSTLVADYKQ